MSKKAVRKNQIQYAGMLENVYHQQLLILAGSFILKTSNEQHSHKKKRRNCNMPNLVSGHLKLIWLHKHFKTSCTKSFWLRQGLSTDKTNAYWHTNNLYIMFCHAKPHFFCQWAFVSIDGMKSFRKSNSRKIG